jgi:hypothetical protein
LLAGAGIDVGTGAQARLGLRTTGPAAHVYVNLQGREPGGTVSPEAYAGLVQAVAAALRSARDPSDFYNPTGAPLFTHVWTRPTGCGRPDGFCTDPNIGQDPGDVFALMAEGYNFDGTQTPPVARLGDLGPAADVYSVPNFYGAHGHASDLPSMSAILYAAGPSLKKKKVAVVRNIDIAPTVLEILNVDPAPTVDGTVIRGVLKKDTSRD